MFFMGLFYVIVALGIFLALYICVFKPIMASEAKKEAERKKEADEDEAKRLAKKAELVGADTLEDIDVRLIQMEELAAKMKALSQTRIIAERIADLSKVINIIKADIAAADEKTKATAKPPVAEPEE